MVYSSRDRVYQCLSLGLVSRYDIQELPPIQADRERYSFVHIFDNFVSLLLLEYMSIKYTTSGFTIIELLIGMTIFSVGLAGIYALLHTTMSNMSYSRDEIIVSGLLREELALVVNTRDTNLRNYIPWDSVHIESSTQTGFASGVYLIENDYSTDRVAVDGTN